MKETKILRMYFQIRLSSQNLTATFAFLSLLKFDLQEKQNWIHANILSRIRTYLLIGILSFGPFKYHKLWQSAQEHNWRSNIFAFHVTSIGLPTWRQSSFPRDELNIYIGVYSIDMCKVILFLTDITSWSFGKTFFTVK